MMLNLKLLDGSALDIPAEAIILIEENVEEKKATNVVYSLQMGENLFDTVEGAYGFIKKQWRDNVNSVGNLLEVTLAAEKPHKMAFSDMMVVARRELKDAPNGAKCRLTLNVNGKITSFNVTDTRDSLAGE